MSSPYAKEYEVFKISAADKILAKIAARHPFLELGRWDSNTIFGAENGAEESASGTQPTG